MSEVKGNIVRIKSGNDQYAIKDTISDYLTNEDLSSYLTKDEAASTYLLKNDGIITTLQSAVSGWSGAINTLRSVATPELPTTNGQYLLKYNSANDNHYTWDQLAITELPPTGSLANGTYILQCEKTANGTTLSWVSTSSSST